MELLKKVPAQRDSNGYSVSMGLFLCPKCGKLCIRKRSHGIRQRTCGCGKYKPHGDSNSRLYKTYNNMLSRCHNTNYRDYHRYGGRGIAVCRIWRKSYISFMEFARKNGYTDDLEIDRIDNNGPYAPWNVQFICASDNRRKRRVTKLSFEDADIIRSGLQKGRTLASLAKEFGVTYQTIQGIRDGRYWNRSD